MAKVIPFRKKDQLGGREARRLISESLKESFIVEAAAGTGKTTELVNRIVAVIRQGEAKDVRNIVAVTFTRKAAGELKLRLRQELDRTLDKSRTAAVPPGELENLERAIEHLEEARIGTIHSFCAEILRERPVEAGIDPAFEELSETEAPRLYHQAFRRWSQAKLSAAPPGLRRSLNRLAARDSDDDRSPLEQLRDAGWKLIEWRDFPAPWSAHPFERDREIDRLAAEVLNLALMSSKCRKPASDNLYKDLRPARDLATWIERAESLRERDYDALEGRLVRLCGDLRRHLRKGSGTFADGVKREDVLAAREALIEALAQFRQKADANLALLLREEMRELLETYDEIKRRSGKLDFVDLLLEVRNLVVGNAEVRRYLQHEFTHIFVDEFQDTDPLQAEILLLLAADDPEQTDWMAARPAPGKLFLVGDPKQSIYRFRRADVIIYQELREALTRKGIRLLRLSESYRAVRPIQEFVNAAFRPEMTGDTAAGQSEYVPLEEVAKERADQPCLIALPVPKPYGSNGEVNKWKVTECLPATLAAFIKWLIEESGWNVRDCDDPEQRPIGIRPRHIAILFRRFSSRGADVTREYLQELELRNIPHLLVGARSFHRREEVETLRAALTAIEWPDDELSVFAALKGSLFAIPDAALLRYKQKLDSLHPFRPPPSPAEHDFQPIADALNLLGKLHRRRNWRPLVETVNALLEATRSHAGFALRPAGGQVLANVYRVADLARSFEMSGGISFRGFVEELREQARKEESADAPVAEEGADGVRIMTVHGAKGLEFPVVILADIGAHLNSFQPDLFVDTQRRLCAMRLLGCAPWDLLEHEDTEAVRDRAEGVRVAYVAATRARDLLVVPAVEDQAGWDRVSQRWGEVWLAPLDKALYPPKELRRTPEVAPGCPPFGANPIVDDDEQWAALRLKPGFHRPQQGTHGVVWWDPHRLALKVEENFGVRQAEVLDERAASEVVEGGRQAYESWKTRRAQVLAEGKRPEFEVRTATEAIEPPPEFTGAIEIEVLPRPEGRPQGRRFGTLVHAILRDAKLDAGDGRREEVAQLAEVQARVLGAPPEEQAAAIEAVLAALRHPLLGRAARAACCHRELPIMLKTADGKLLEGVIDLAFLEKDAWTVVDFKTDAHLPQRAAAYERQLQWYVFALSRMKGQPARGCLLGV